MASTSNTQKDRRFFKNVTQFPPVIDGRINVVKFLEASTDLLALLEHFGKIFAPAKYDMQGNIDKIKKFYKYDANSCLLELMLDEVKSGKPLVAEGVLWLNRSLLFFDILFQEIIACLQTNQYNIGMKKIFTVAYEGSVKKYHNWVTQQIFAVVCKMSPTLPQILKALDADEDLKVFIPELTNFKIKLHLVTCKIDDFFKEHNLFNDDDSKECKAS